MWRYWQSLLGVVPAPLVFDGLVYTIEHGGIFTISAPTHRRGREDRTRRSAPASYSASPIATGGRIYIANDDGIVVVVRASKDSAALAANDSASPSSRRPLLSEGRIYVRGQKTPFSFGGR